VVLAKRVDDAFVHPVGGKGGEEGEATGGPQASIQGTDRFVRPLEGEAGFVSVPVP